MYPTLPPRNALKGADYHVVVVLPTTEGPTQDLN